jgi:hypothetical protein
MNTAVPLRTTAAASEALTAWERTDLQKVDFGIAAAYPIRPPLAWHPLPIHPHFLRLAGRFGAPKPGAIEQDLNGQSQ